MQTQAGAASRRPWWQAPAAAVGEALAAEQDRWFLWVPVLFGAGIAIYFSLPVEPRLELALVPAGLALVLWSTWRRGGAALLVTSALLAATLGLAAAKLRADLVAAPVIARQAAPLAITGWVELVEPRTAGDERVTVRVAAIEGLAREAWPFRVRVRVLAVPTTPLSPGEAVRVVATLSPPAPPALPGGFDFARSAWFQRLGGVGFARAAAEPATIAETRPLDVAVRSAVERVRQAIGARIRAALAGETGAIANALITGERGGITEATNEAFRDSGLFHILSISGLHMVIMAGSVFLAVRFLLSLVPMLALRYPIKKWAATAAAAGAFGYLLISGASFPTVRSWIMISIMYLAVMLDRPAVALRNVAIAALLILVLWPESLVDPGFQMSFAAVVSLVAAYEWLRARRPFEDAPRGGLLMQGLRVIAGILLTTLIASFAVTPIAAWHFHKSQQYAMIANLVAIPLCNLIVMPAALATLIAMPLGLERWPLALMGVGIDGMVWVAYAVAALPGAVGRIPAFSTTAFALMVAGGLWLTLWRGRWRLLGLIPAAAGLALAFWREPPDVLVGRGGRLVAVRGADGLIEARADNQDRFDLARWLEHDGDGRPTDEVRRPRAFRCDWAGCVAPGPRGGGGAVAISRHPAALLDDCRMAAIVIIVGRRGLGCGATGAGAASAAGGAGTAEAERAAGAAVGGADLVPGTPGGAAGGPGTGGGPGAGGTIGAGGGPGAAGTTGTAGGQRPLAGRPLVLAEPELTAGGAFAIRRGRDGSLSLRSVAAERGVRPWSAAGQERAGWVAATGGRRGPQPAASPPTAPAAGGPGDAIEQRRPRSDTGRRRRDPADDDP